MYRNDIIIIYTIIISTYNFCVGLLLLSSIVADRRLMGRIILCSPQLGMGSPISVTLVTVAMTLFIAVFHTSRLSGIV